MHDTPEPIDEYVRRRLEETRGRWKQISRDSGVPYFTIAKIVQRVSKNPRIDTLRALQGTLEQLEKAA